MAIDDRRHVQDHCVTGFEPPLARTEVEVSAKLREGRAIAEPGEGSVKVFVHAVVRQVLHHQVRGLALGHSFA